MNYAVRTTLASSLILTSLILGGCAAGAPTTTTNTSTPGEVKVEEKLVTVDIRIARSLFDPEGTLTDAEIVAAAAEKDIVASVDGDTVIYTMTKGQRDQMLSDMRTSTKQSIDELIADESNSITAVEFDEAMTSFRVSVDAARYSQFEALLALAFYIPGALYQQLNGVAAEAIDVTVNFVDGATGEVLNTGSYQEMRKNLEQ